MNPSREQISHYLHKILSSRYFKKSKISCDLLSYLTEATLNGNDPKEYTIGVELFGLKYEDTTKQDSNIRVYIHNVRKRLSEYYDNEGEKDEFYFEIEKGKYRVNFISPIKKQQKRIYLVPFLVSTSIVIILAIALLLRSKENQNFWRKSVVWSEFSNNETILVLGDYFVFTSELPTGGNGIQRDFSINSEKDFDELISEKPELAFTMSKSNLTYLSKMAAFCQNDILQVMGKLERPVKIKLLSDLQPDDLQDNNIVFIGNYKNTGLFENLITQMEFPYSLDSSIKKVIVSDDTDAKKYQLPSTSDKNQIDYAMVMSFLGFNRNKFLFFLSSLDIGNISTTGIFADKEYLEDFEKQYLKGKTSSDFKALYQVQGINKTDLSYELIRVD